jgi:pimeloyl-ACP methyl ester carboxylesterase
VKRFIEAGVLNVAYEEKGNAHGWPVVLLHGFPYDAWAYDEVASILASNGARIIVPTLRGFGDTTFLSPATPRSGEQAALGKDLLDLLDALGIGSAFLAGYDWGGRAACVVAALWPERATGLVTQNGYNIQNIAASGEPATPDNELRYWYQYYFHSERGRKGLTENRRELSKLLWRLWSPTWSFDDETFQRSADSFDNPDFVEVVIHSYRHRYGLVRGDPDVALIESNLATQPTISVPSIILDGDVDGVAVVGAKVDLKQHFAGWHEHRVVKGGGHNLPQEKPDDFAKAVLDVRLASLSRT